MNLIYISPHYPMHYIHFIRSLNDFGVNVFGIGTLFDNQIDHELMTMLKGYYRIDAFENLNSVIEASKFFHERHGRMDRVESHLESWIETEAIVRDRFDIPGIRQSEIGFIKKKSLMKGVFHKAGVPCATGRLVSSFDDCLKFASGGFPIFIKPDMGVGADDTYTIQNKDDLRAFFATRRSYDYFMEEYVSGVIESFDGLTDGNGRIVFCTSHVFSNDVHRILANNENLWYESVREIPADLETMGRKVVAAAGIREKFFHIEFFRLANGSLKALEINMRPPGGLTTHMFNYACDIDVYRWWAAVVTGREYPCDYELKYHCAYVGRKHDRAYKHSHQDILAQWRDNIPHEQPMNPIEYAVMGNHGYLVRSTNRLELRSAISFIHEPA